MEISCIYKKRDKTRKIHCLVFLPDFAGAAKFNLALSRIGNITSDGRPILGLDAKELLKITLDSSAEAVFIPAHAWTPHFSVFGAASGFDSRGMLRRTYATYPRYRNGSLFGSTDELAALGPGPDYTHLQL